MFKEIFEYFFFFMTAFKLTKNLTTRSCRAFNSAQNELTLNASNGEDQVEILETKLAGSDIKFFCFCKNFHFFTLNYFFLIEKSIES